MVTFTMNVLVLLSVQGRWPSNPGSRLGHGGQGTEMRKGRKKSGQVQTPWEVSQENKSSSSSGWLDGSFEIIPRMLKTAETEIQRKLHLAGDHITQSHTLLCEALTKGKGLTNTDAEKNGGLRLVLGSVVNLKSQAQHCPSPITFSYFLVESKPSFKQHTRCLFVMLWASFSFWAFSPPRQNVTASQSSHHSPQWAATVHFLLLEALTRKRPENPAVASHLPSSVWVAWWRAHSLCPGTTWHQDPFLSFQWLMGQFNFTLN